MGFEDFSYIAGVPPLASAEPRPAFHEAPPVDPNAWTTRFWTPILNDPRDAIFLNLGAMMALTVWPAAFALFYLGSFSLWLIVPYAGLLAMWADRYTLMLHCISHRPLFNKRHQAWAGIIQWTVGIFMGQTPTAYFVHHMGMHHREGNLFPDLSSTMPFQRDKFTHWFRYWFRFMTIGLFELLAYHYRGGRKKLAQKLLIGELGYIAAAALLAYFVSLEATLVVFVGPVVVMRTLMMAGNWGQHAFVDARSPDCDFRNSITCINSRYNRRCFNDGYHIIHHLKPSLHYTEMADEFDKNRALYGAEDSIVFQGTDFFGVWLMLMLGQQKKLAEHFVQLPGAPVRTQEQVLGLFHERLAQCELPSGAAVAAV
jgi:fatty acid desaturase